MKLTRCKNVVLSVATGGLLLAALLLVLARTSPAARANPGSLFVKPDGSGSLCSQASPCALQTALARATDGDIIYLAGGLYTGSGGAVITLTRSVVVRGGWDGSTASPPACNPTLYPTTIDGQGARRGVFVGSGITVTLEGCTLINGVDTFGGAGLYARDAYLTLRHLTVYSNVIDVWDVPGTMAYGAGVMVEGCTLVVDKSTFRNNSAWAARDCFGGGLAISNTLAATVTASLFQDNDAWTGSGLSFLGVSGDQNTLILRDSTFVGNGYGRGAGRGSGGYAAALWVSKATARIEGNAFTGNHAGNDHGALGISRSDLLLARNVISGNKCARTSGLYLVSVSPFTATNNIIANGIVSWPQESAVRVVGGNGRFLHNTVARNASPIGFLLGSGAVVTLTNTILVSHTVGISVASGSTAALEATFWGSGDWANGTEWAGDGTLITGTINVRADPGFVNPAAGNYHLRPGSAAINAGVDARVASDIDNDPRPIGAGYDIGADEYAVRLHLPVVWRRSP